MIWVLLLLLRCMILTKWDGSRPHSGRTQALQLPSLGSLWWWERRRKPSVCLDWSWPRQSLIGLNVARQLLSWHDAIPLVGFPQQVDQTLSHEGPEQKEQDCLAGDGKGPPPLLLKDNMEVRGVGSDSFISLLGSQQKPIVTVETFALTWFLVFGLSVNLCKKFMVKDKTL